MALNKKAVKRFHDLSTWRCPEQAPVGDVLMTTEAGTVVESIQLGSRTRYRVRNNGFSDCVRSPEFLAEAIICIEKIVIEYVLLKMEVGDG